MDKKDFLEFEEDLEAVRDELYGDLFACEVEELVRFGGIPFTQVPTTGCGGVSSSDHGYP